MFLIVENILNTYLQGLRRIRLLQHLLDRYQQFLSLLTAQGRQMLFIEIQESHCQHDKTQQHEPATLPEIGGYLHLNTDGFAFMTSLGAALHLKDIGTRLQTGIAHRVFTGLQGCPLVLKTFQPADVILCLPRIAQCRETQGKRFVGLVQSDSLCMRDVAVKNSAVAGSNLLIIHHQIREREVFRIDSIHILATYLGQSLHTPQKDCAIGAFHSRIPVEALTQQAVALTIINKRVLARGIDRQPVIGGNP